MRRRLHIASGVFAVAAAVMWAVAAAAVADLDLLSLAALIVATASAAVATIVSALCVAVILARDKDMEWLIDRAMVKRYGEDLRRTLPLRVIR